MSAIPSIGFSVTIPLDRKTGAEINVQNILCILYYYEEVFYQWKSNIEGCLL